MLVSVTAAVAQTGGTGYEFLRVPVSAHSAALGGSNVTLDNDDASLMFDNPAQLSNVSDRTLNLNYTSYIAGSMKLSCGFVKQFGERITTAFGAQLLNYGSMKETDSAGSEIGSFSARDIDVQGSFAYLLSERWSGAVTMKLLFGNYANYSSFAMGVDLGVNYYNEEKGLSMSLVGRNLGGQLKALYDDREKLPFDLSLGFSKQLASAPVRISLTFDDLTQWHNVGFFKHLIVGAEVMPTSYTWLALGYNIRRGSEMKANGSSHWAGFSFGAGLSIKKLKLGVAWAKYHIAASSLLVNASFAF